MLEIEVRNFQSISSVKVLVEGFTAILGRSNIGKSAFIRAVQCALTGAVGTDFVRHGPQCERHVRGNKKCNCCSSVIFRSPKLSFTWEKGDNVNRYTVVHPDTTTEVFEGLERGTPPFLLPDYRMVQVGSKKELVQIPAQFEPIFLLDQSGTVVADVLSDVARLDHINKAIGLVNKDRKETQTRRKVREEDVRNLASKLSKFDGLDDVPIAEVEALGARVRDTRQRLNQIDRYIERLQALKLSLQSLTKALEPKLPDVACLETQHRSLLQVTSFQDRAVAGKVAFSALSAATKPTLPNILPAQSFCEDLGVSEDFLSRYLDRTQHLESLFGVDSIILPEVSCLDVATTLQRMDSLLQRLQATQETVSRYTPLERLPEVSSEAKALRLWPKVSQVFDYSCRYTQLQEAVSRGELLATLTDSPPEGFSAKVGTLSRAFSWLDRLTSIRDTYTTVSREQVLVETEVTSVKSELEALGTCPACSQPFVKGQHLHLEGL